jgi:hypothetical protein
MSVNLALCNINLLRNVQKMTQQKIWKSNSNIIMHILWRMDHDPSLLLLACLQLSLRGGRGGSFLEPRGVKMIVWSHNFVGEIGLGTGEVKQRRRMLFQQNKRGS